MSCREIRPLLSRFLDGELDARQMCVVALHCTRCRACEYDLRHFEQIQDVVASHIAAQVDDFDLSEVWTGVAPRLEPTSRSSLRALREWWEQVDMRWAARVPAYAAVAAAAVLAVLLWQRDPASPPTEIAAIDNSAILDSVQSNVGSLALLREPETNTMVLWITDDSPGSLDDF